MTIIASDIKILKSERMTDAEDGGGRMTSTEVPDGVAGSIFPKVSRLDAVYGRVNLRKVYVAVQSALTETYGGALTIITEPPANDRISVVLFSTDSHFDDRTAARDRIESYVVAGPLSRARLYGAQVINQKSLLLYQRTDEPLPDVGTVICLSVEAVGYAPAQQYVRIDELAHEVRTFTDSAGDFDRRVLSLKLTTALQQTFPGLEPSRYSNDASPTKVRDCQVADASRYFGICQLAAPVDVGDIDVKVESIYAPLVPSTQRETAVSMSEVAGASVFVASGDPITFAWNSYWAGGQTSTHFLPTGVLPGSFEFSGQNVKDDAKGGLSGNNGTTGTIDYATGSVTMTYSPQNTSQTAYGANVTYTPALQVSAQAHTASDVVTLATRGIVYLHTLNPLPGVGSVTVDYRALGKWYRLRDNGSGQLVGNSAAEGSGQVSYTSGALRVTLGALPDIDSEIIYTWASSVHFAKRAGSTVDNPARGWHLPIQLAHLPVKPGSVTVSWLSNVGGAVGTYADPTGSGVLTPNNGGVSPGTINYVTGEIMLPYGQDSSQGGISPATETNVTVAYQQELPTGSTPLVTSQVVTVTNPASFNCGFTNISPRSFRAVCPVNVSGGYSLPAQDLNVTVVDNGAGMLVMLSGSTATPGGSAWTTAIWWIAGEVVGSIDYTTGDVLLTGFPMHGRSWSSSGVSWISDSQSTIPPTIGDYTVSSKAAATVFAAKTEVLSVASIGLTYDLSLTNVEPIVPGSIFLDFVSDRYVDRAGKLYRSVNTTTNAGIESGTIDYNTGIVKITSAPVSNMGRWSGTPVSACLTAHGEFTVSEVSFRTAGSPVRAGSTYVQATALDGALCSGSADSNGVITGTHLRGTVRALTGVAHVEFGDIVSGDWVPRQVFPSTIRYSCVVLRNLPLDASILGLDPVRLPADGRVPVIRPADVCVIHETGKVTLPNPAVAGAVFSSGRSKRTVANPPGADIVIPACTMMELRDAAGQRIPDDRYTVDLVEGTGTLANPLNLSGYAQPLVLHHRIEDMALVSDAQITGDVSLAAPTLYAYTTSAYLSTALLGGDISARIEHLFDQQAWTSVWSDAVIGNGANAQFNDLDYPIEVANSGAVKERWRLNFLNGTDYQIIGENLGVLPGTYSTAADASPVNSRAGRPYFTIRRLGLGAGWTVGNQVRFNTVGANYPVWNARTILGGAALTGDSYYLSTRGDID
jgi:hypothetical protein